MQRTETKRQLIGHAFQRAQASGNGLGDRLPHLTVGQVMTANPLSVPAERTALELVELFHEMRFRHLLVTEDGNMAGVISDRDVVRLFGSHDSPERDYLATITAGELMSVDLVTISPEAPLLDAVGLMLANGISCLPVVSDGVAVGILTGTDLFLALEQFLGAAAPALAEAN